MKYIKAKLTFLIVLILAIMTGCGREAPKSEKEIVADLNNSTLTTLYANANRGLPYEITEIDIIKRNTDEDNGTDYIHCTFVATDDYSEMTGELELYYGYYTEGGWCIDNDGCVSYNIQYLPVAGVDETDALHFIDEPMYHNAVLISHTTDLDACMDSLEYDISSNGEIYSTTGTITVTFSYDTTTGDWLYYDTFLGDDIGIQWNVRGTYELRREDGYDGLYGRTLYYFGDYEYDDFYGNAINQHVMGFSFSPSNEYDEDTRWYDLSTWRVFLNENYINADLMDYNYINFNFDSLYLYDHPEYVFTKISDGLADPKAYSDVVGIGYSGPDIGGDELIEFEAVPFEPYYY